MANEIFWLGILREKFMPRGDHIFVNCLGYSHHGIDCGDDQVIHFDFRPQQKMSRWFRKDDPSQIRKTSLASFSRGRPIVVRKYQHPSSADKVILRAEQRIGDSGYRLFRNNCEHFAQWCVTGRSESTQVDAARDAAVPLFGGLITTALVRFSPLLPPQLRLFAGGVALTATLSNATAQYLVQRRFDRESRRS